MSICYLFKQMNYDQLRALQSRQNVRNSNSKTKKYRNIDLLTLITVSKCTRSTLHVKHTFVTSLAPISLLACTTVTGNFIFTHTMLAWVWTAVINYFFKNKNI